MTKHQYKSVDTLLCIAWLVFLIWVISTAGCAASQSPPISTDKQVIVNVKGNNNTIIIEYKQATDVELGGGNSTSTKQDGELSIPVWP